MARAKARAKAKAKAPAKADAAVDPDKLVRQQAGMYRTGDGRFEVREADAGWFLVDPDQTNEFGQELIRGPFATLKAVRDALPDARAAQPAAKRRPTPREPTRTNTKKPPKLSKPQRSWIDELAKGEAAEVRKLIAALNGEGIPDAEALVRRDREGLLPAVAARLIATRLEVLVSDLPESGRDALRDFVQRVANVLAVQGTTVRTPLPGWMLIEVGREPEPADRRIDFRE